MTTRAPLGWIKEIQNTLIDAKAIPLSGYAPPFPWEALAAKLAPLLQTPKLHLSARKTQFLKGSEVTSGLGSGFLTIAIDLTPLGGQAYWLMGKEDVAKLTALALLPSNGSKGFSSAKFQEGFYYYLATEALVLADELKAFGDLAPKIAKNTSFPEEEALCFDIDVQHPKRTFWGRLVCPASFHAAFKAHFATMPAPSITGTLAKTLSVKLGVELGRSVLSLSTWKSISVGDFVVLDRCTFDPHTHKGTATLTLNEIPLLRARIKENSLKIVDYANYREELSPMKPEIPPEKENSDEPLSDEFGTEEAGNDNHLWSGENHTTEEIVSTSEIPLTLTVEVARMNIHLEKLLQLSPGNVLELPVRPEQGVDLLIGGQKVAKGELVKIGEMLGVKILELKD